jgi:hypothetical protein
MRKYELSDGEKKAYVRDEGPEEVYVEVEGGMSANIARGNPDFDVQAFLAEQVENGHTVTEVET